MRSPPPSPARATTATERVLRVLVWVAPLVITGWWTINTINDISRVGIEPGDHFHDFFEFYSGAQAVREGTSLYAAGRLGYIYPPLLAVVLAPLTAFPIGAAAAVWLGLKVVAMGVSAVVGGRAMVQRFGLALTSFAPWAVGFVASIGFLLIADKVRAEFRMQQSNALLLACWVLGLWWIDRRPALAGAVLGLAVNIKYLALIALPYFLIRRRWKAGAGMVASTAVFALAPALVLGWEGNLDAWRRALGGLGSMLAGSAAESAASGDAKVMSFDSIGVSVTKVMVTLSGEPGLTPMSLLLVGAIAAVVVGVIWMIYRRRGWALFAPAGRAGELTGAASGQARLVALEWSGLIVLALAFSPQTNTRHLVQLILPAMAIGAAFLAPADGFSPVRGRVLAVLAGAMLLAGLVIPPSYSDATRQLAREFNNNGWPSWMTLGSFVLLLVAAVPNRRLSDEPASSRAGASPRPAAP